MFLSRVGALHRYKSLNNGLLDMISKGQATKGKIDENIIKIKHFCYCKYIIAKMMRQSLV